MKHSIEQEQRITRDLGKYRLAPPSPDLQDRVMRAAREALANSSAGLPWTDRWLLKCGAFRQEILAFASTVMLILGVLMQLVGGQSVLADSIERLKAMSIISGNLQRAISMDCIILKPSVRDENSRYRVRWNTAGVTRVDVDSTNGKGQTLWISNGTVSVADDEDGTVRSMAITTIPSEGQTPIEFLTPMTLAQQMKERYGFMQSELQNGAEPHEFLLIGQEDQLIIEIAVDAKTYLPTMLKKYSSDSARTGKEWNCIEEVRFQWNKPIPPELLVPRLSALKRQVN